MQGELPWSKHPKHDRHEDLSLFLRGHIKRARKTSMLVTLVFQRASPVGKLQASVDPVSTGFAHEAGRLL